MPETRDIRSVLEAAEQAAAARDYASAEQLLREAASLQEATLGPLHPDLANTLNNLGVVCEIVEKPLDAEQCFRRACAITTAVLQSDDPIVAMSRKNLEDFCAARGMAVDLPTRPTDVAAELNASKKSSAEEPQPVASRRASHPFAAGALIAGGLLVTFIAAATWLRSNDEVEPSLATPTVSLPESPATATSPPPTGIGPATGGPSAVPSVRPPPQVAAAELCTDFSTSGRRGSSGDWQCVSPGAPVAPGRIVFYTRVKSPTDTTVQHRWYSGKSLRQAVELPIRANTNEGYRTFSRYAVTNQGGAEWRVELRARDGALLHEERFAVR